MYFSYLKHMVAGLACVGGILLSQGAYAGQSDAGVERNQLVNKLIRHLEQQCEYPKASRDYWNLLEVKDNDAKADVRHTSLSSFSLVVEFNALLPSLDLLTATERAQEMRCNAATVDNQISLLKDLIQKNASESDAIIHARQEGELAGFIALRQYFNSQPLTVGVKDELARLFGRVEQEQRFKVSLYFLVGFMQAYGHIHLIPDATDAPGYEKQRWLEQFYARLFNNVFQRYVVEAPHLWSEKTYVGIAITGKEREKYLQRFAQLYQAINTAEKSQVEHLLAGFLKDYQNYEDLKVFFRQEYSKTDAADSFDEVITPEELAAAIVKAYAFLNERALVVSWLAKSELLYKDVSFEQRCFANRIVADDKLEKFLQQDKPWYAEQLAKNRCDSDIKNAAIFKKFDYGKLLQRLEQGCENPSDLFVYTDIQFAQYRQYIADSEFYNMSDKYALDNGNLSATCKAAIKANNTDILTFLINNLPSTAGYYDSALEQLKSLKP
jgi:hypothetical protein